MEKSNSKNRSGKGKYPDKRSRDFDKREFSNKSKVSSCDKPEGGNDVSWYLKNPQLIKDTANLPFGKALGLPITVDDVYQAEPLENPNQAVTTCLPGINVLWYQPTYSISKDNVSALNIASRNIYSYVRHANSGASNYDAPDLMLYLLAMDSIYSQHANLTRAYGLARTFSGVNRYLAKQLVEAIGFQYDDLIANMANYRAQINTLALRMSSLYVPTTMTVFLRHMWMNKNIYTDAPGAKSQMYAFAPTGYYTYNEYDGPGKLTWNRFGDVAREPRPMSWYLERANDALNILLESEDIGIMSGDILKCYGESGLFTFGTIDAEFTIVPTYNEEVLMQIHNATVLNCNPATLTNADITQDVESGALLYAPTFGTYNPGSSSSGIIDLYTKDTSPEMVTVATRLRTTASIVDSHYVEDILVPGGQFVDLYSYTCAIDSCGTEVIVESIIYTLESDGEMARTLSMPSDVLLHSWGYMNQGTAFDVRDAFTTLGKFANFDWNTLSRFWEIVDTAEGPRLSNKVDYINDIDNFAILSNSTMRAIHDVVALAVFDVPITK